MGITNNKLELAVGSVSQRGYVDTIDFNNGNDSIYKITSKYIGPELKSIDLCFYTMKPLMVK